jgi:hypothetical protein
MSTGHEETKAGGTEAGAQSPADDEQEAPVAVPSPEPDAEAEPGGPAAGAAEPVAKPEDKYQG